MTANFGISLPQYFQDGAVDPQEIADYVTTAEALGYHSGWVLEEILKAPMLDPIGLLNFVAARTTRLRLGTAVLVIPPRSPLHLAKELSSLDLLSNGRVIVGVGLGTSTRSYPAFGIPTERRAGRYVDAIRTLKALWTEDSVTYKSDFRTFNGETMLPKPVQKPHPPIWFSGYAPPALRRAVRMGNGWIGGKISTPEFADYVGKLRALLDEEGKDPAGFTIAKRAFIGVDSNRDRIEKRLMDWFGATYGKAEEAKTGAIYGGAQECADKVAELVEAGAELVVLDPIFEKREQMEILATEIVAKLQ